MPTLLAEAHGALGHRFTGGFDTLDLKEAKALLEEPSLAAASSSSKAERTWPDYYR
jgi:hypothetical protein